MTDIEIASTVKLKPITETAKKLGIDPEVIELYGKYKAKLPLDLIQPARMQGKHLILVSAISPTPAGEGKTTISIGLTEGLNRIGKKTTVVLREPSLSKVVQQEAVTHRCYRWKISISILQVTSMPSRKPITCWQP